jgi:hypothetical protein
MPPAAVDVAGVTWIGRVVEGPAGVTFVGAADEALAGFEHSF